MITDHLTCTLRGHVCGFILDFTHDDGESPATKADLYISDGEATSLAGHLGWCACHCARSGETDGSVPCPCGRSVAEMHDDACGWLADRVGGEVNVVEEYYYIAAGIEY